MTPKKGIDVSKYQGTINWEKVKPQIDFAILRAGFADNQIDTMFQVNANECTRLGIPFGVYWFSYATTIEEAKSEADYVCNAVKPYKLLYPVCFDYEYDSDRYAKECGITPTKEYRAQLAKTFLERVEERGYFATLYSNPDYLNKGFSELINRFDLWLAHWGIASPSRSCGMWQSSCTGKIDGINGNVDTDIAYKDYPSLITAKNLNGTTNEENKESELEKVKQEEWEKYYALAQEVLVGKWGNGEDRKVALKAKGYDYNYVQNIVNALLK